ncbi:MAG: putative toxin-antitoxin system toxin component, PIN family [Chitinophagales bacterium]
MKVVIDTNVFISSIVFKGKARQVYDFCIENTDIFISDFIIVELSNTLHIKFNLPKSQVKLIIKSMLNIIENIKPTTVLPTVCRDLDDNNILQLCETIEADFLITGDNDLLVLKKYLSTKILNPTDFLHLNL